jgi:benzylsuccinate CoA-transferase BbsF subunit
VSQVEAAVYSLTPWLLDFQSTGAARGRDGNRDATALVHDVFRSADEGDLTDRWVAIAAWTDAEREALGRVAGEDVAAWAAGRSALAAADALQAVGVEAVPVQDFGDLHADPQLAHRGHFVARTHPFMGDGLYERNGIRYSVATAGYDRAGPTLGQDQEWVLGELLGLTDAEQQALAAAGAFD